MSQFSVIWADKDFFFYLSVYEQNSFIINSL